MLTGNLSLNIGCLEIASSRNSPIYSSNKRQFPNNPRGTASLSFTPNIYSCNSLTFQIKSNQNNSPFLTASLLSRGAEPEELRYLPNVLETPARVRGPVPGGRHHLPAHGRLQLAAPRAEIHQLHGLLREHTEASVQGGAVSRLSRFLGVNPQRRLNGKDFPSSSRDGELRSTNGPGTFVFTNFGFLSVFVCKVNVCAWFGGEFN